MFVDTPKRASLSFLSQLDEEPGLWLGQPKHDGWRRILTLTAHGWIATSRYSSGREAVTPLPRVLLDALYRLDGPVGTMIDAEWVGPRHPQVEHRLYLFDLLAWGPKSMSDVGFQKRHDKLIREYGLLRGPIQTLPVFGAPGLRALFDVQKHFDTSEGIVVRRATSKLCGGENGQWFKFKMSEVADAA